MLYRFLFPFMEDDPVLQALGENDDQEENCEGQTRADVAMDRMKRQFEHIRVDAK